MNHAHPGRVSAALLLLGSLAGAAALAGCATEVASASLGVRSRDAALAAVAAGARAKAKGPRDRYVAIRGKKRMADGLAFVQTTPDVFAPFDVSIRFGLLDPSRSATADGVRACLEVDSVGFTVFYDVCADYDAGAGGWSLFAFTGAPPISLPGTLFVPGAEGELRVETDGVTLRFHGRARGAPAWGDVASTPWPGQTEALKAAFGASRVRRGTEVGFDHPGFSSANAPGPLTPEREVAADGNAALLAGLAAFLALDGATPDFAAAATALASAQTSLVEARAGADALPDGTAARKARKKLAKAARQLDEAIAKVGEQDADRSLASLARAAAAAEAGILLLVPQPFPG